LHLRPVSGERLRRESAALQQLLLRRAAAARANPTRPPAAQRAAGRGRAGDARGPSADAAVLLRQQAPGEAAGRRLVRQRHERGVQQGPGAHGAAGTLSTHRIGCEISHWLESFDQVLCIAYAPLPMLTFADPPWPELIQAHSSPFSWPVMEVQPPPGF